MSKRGRERTDRDVRRAASAIQTRPESPPLSRTWIAFAGVALFLMAAGARWWLIGKFGADVPWLDQWDAEAQGLYQQWDAGHLQVRDLFAPHNEHRIFFTRVLALVLVSLNRQWDPRLQMAVNAVLYAAMAAGLFLVLQKGQRLRFQIFCWALVAALAAAPYGATNTLLGFQSQFYFLSGFSLTAIYGLVNARPGSLLWTVGVLSGAAALVSMASGHAAAAAALGALVCSSLRRGREFPRHLLKERLTILAACLLIASGFYLRHTPPEHAQLAAKSAGDFIRMLIACLAWPGMPMALLAALSWLPFAAFLLNYFRKKTNDDRIERFVIGIGLWALLQAVGLAIYRANSGEGLESRYLDVLVFGLLANAICAMWLLEAAWRPRKATPALTAIWFAAAGIGLYGASSSGIAFEWKRDMEIRRAATAGYLATGDRRYLDRAPPYTDPGRLAQMLQDPSLRRILPAGIRKPLALTPRNGSPPPEYVNGLSAPDLANVTPGVWTSPGMFSRFAVIPPSTRFEYGIRKESALPFLLLYVSGDMAGAEIDGMLRLPGDDAHGHHAVLSCRTEQRVLMGRSGRTQLAIGEPKEIGALSVAALFAAIWGAFVVAAGALLFPALWLALKVWRR